jgi:hypothetical protein
MIMMRMRDQVRTMLIWEIKLNHNPRQAQPRVRTTRVGAPPLLDISFCIISFRCPGQHYAFMFIVYSLAAIVQ